MPNLIAQYASGPAQLPTSALTVQALSGGAFSGSGSLYFAVQARNRVGVNLPQSFGPYAYSPGQQLDLTLTEQAATTGSDWQAWVLSASTSADLTTFTQLAVVTATDLPATLSLSRDAHLALNSIVANPGALPQGSDLLPGMVRFVASLSQYFTYQPSSSAVVDNTTVLAATLGRWERIGSASPIIANTGVSGGCDRPLLAIEPELLPSPPVYSADRSLGTGLNFWLRNTSDYAATKGIRLGLVVRLQGEEASQLFNGLLEIEFLGYVNCITGDLDTTGELGLGEMPGVGVRVAYQYGKSGLMLPKDLPANSAWSARVYPSFGPESFGGQLAQGARVEVCPIAFAQSGDYNAVGLVTGDLVLPEDDQLRVVAGAGLAVQVLSGGALVANYLFPSQAPQTLGGLVSETADQQVCLNGNGALFVRPANTPVAASEALRALVSTTSGTSNPGPWSAYTAVAANNTLNLSCAYPCTADALGIIRPDYPDYLLAGNAKGRFNPLKLTLYLQRQSTGELRAFRDRLVIPALSQSFAITNWESGELIPSVPTQPQIDFSLYAPGAVSLTPQAGGTLPADSYRATYAFVYEGSSVTAISHDPVRGCLRTLKNSLTQALAATQYWGEPLSTLTALRALPLAEVSPFQARYVIEANNPYRYNPSSLVFDDGYRVIRPTATPEDTPGRFLLDDSNAVLPLSGPPSLSIPAELNDLGIEVDSNYSTVGNVYTRSTTSWILVGNIRGAAGESVAVRNAYDPDTQYQKLNIVFYRGGSYIYIYPTSAAGIPPTEASYWQLLAEGVTPLPSYDPNFTYYRLCLVPYQGSSYLYIHATPTSGISPTTQTHWQLLAEKGASGTIGSSTGLIFYPSIPPTTGINEYAIFVDNSDLVLKRREPENGLIQSLAPRQVSVTYTTASLTDSTAEIGRIPLGKVFLILVVTSTAAARVQLYTSSTEQQADATRPIGTDPPKTRGVVMDLVLTTDSLSESLPPRFVWGADMELPRTSSVPIVITNLSGISQSISVEILYLPWEL